MTENLNSAYLKNLLARKKMLFRVILKKKKRSSAKKIKLWCDRKIVAALCSVDEKIYQETKILQRQIAIFEIGRVLL